MYKSENQILKGSYNRKHAINVSEALDAEGMEKNGVNASIVDAAFSMMVAVNEKHSGVFDIENPEREVASFFEWRASKRAGERNTQPFLNGNVSIIGGMEAAK